MVEYAIQHTYPYYYHLLEATPIFIFECVICKWRPMSTSLDLAGPDLPSSMESNNHFKPIAYTQDLTGQVTITEFHSFASGGFANIWKGQWLQKSGNIQEVQTYLLDYQPFLMVFISIGSS